MPELNDDQIFNKQWPKIDPINNTSTEKMEPGVKVENWVLAVGCTRDTLQKVVVLL